MRVRPAEAEDLGALLRLERGSAEAPHWSEEVYREMLKRARGPDARAAVFVAEGERSGGAGDRGGAKAELELMGFVVATLQAELVAEIESVVVDPGHRRRGTGARLCGEAMDWCARCGSVRCDLEVRSHGVAARGLYRRLGFAETGERRNYYRSPSDDAVLMSLDLRAGDWRERAEPSESC